MIPTQLIVKCKTILDKDSICAGSKCSTSRTGKVINMCIFVLNKESASYVKKTLRYLSHLFQRK